MGSLGARLGEQLKIVEEDELSFDEVQAARVEGREAFCKVIHVIYAD